MSVTWTVRNGRAEWSGRLLSEWVDELVPQVVAISDPDTVWLFGSVARGDDDENSDIDLLVVLPDLDPDRTIDLKRSLHREVTVPVPFDVAFSTSDRFTERSTIPGTVERAAKQHGRRVYERP